jgi:hypothetical protein
MVNHDKRKLGLSLKNTTTKETQQTNNKQCTGLFGKEIFKD